MTHRRENDAGRSDRAFKKWQEALARGLGYLDMYREDIQEDRPTITEIRLKCDPDDEAGVLAVVKGYVGSEWFVAFHRTESISSCITEVGNRLRNGSLKWRKDTPYEGK